MTRERLQQLSDADLLLLAELFRLDLDEPAPARAELEQILFEVIAEAQAEQDQIDTFPISYHQRRFESVEEIFGYFEMSSGEPFEFLSSYNVTRIGLLLRDPAWAYTYWDISVADRASLSETDGQSPKLFLRLQEVNELKTPDQLHEMEIPIQLTDNAWYLNLPNRETKYKVSLCVADNTKRVCLACSKLIAVPRGSFTEALEIIESFETDSLIALSGIEHLGNGEIAPEIPQRILKL